MRTRSLASLLSCVLLASAPAAAEPLRWSPTITSAGAAAGPPRVDLSPACHESDARLAQVARRLVARRLDGGRPPTSREVETLVRAAGVPHPFAQAWLGTGPRAIESLGPRAAHWARSARGVTRCGLAEGHAPGLGDVVALVAVDATAELASLPARPAPTDWVSLRALARVPIDEAKVVLLGPHGGTRTVLTSVDLDTGHVRSTFRLGEPGRWRVQILASTSRGPEPVLELELFSGVRPPATLARAVEPATAPPTAAGAQGALELLNRARRAEGLAPLRRDGVLDAVAHEHASRMLDAQRIAHDVGHGDPATRAVAGGVVAWTVGENVAHAASIAAAHDAMWLSPSHRGNMLHPTYERVGVAALRDAEGRWWVVQLFAA